MMVGDGAEAFARQKGVDLVPPEYFYHGRRLKELEREKEKERKKQQQSQPEDRLAARRSWPLPVERKYGTVGAVALDKAGKPRGGDFDRRQDQQESSGASATRPSSARELMLIIVPAPSPARATANISCGWSSPTTSRP